MMTYSFIHYLYHVNKWAFVCLFFLIMAIFAISAKKKITPHQTTSIYGNYLSSTTIDDYTNYSDSNFFSPLYTILVSMYCLSQYDDDLV